MNDRMAIADIESELLELLGGILGHGQATRNDSLFDLGAGSLLVIQLYALIEQRRPGIVSVQDVFDRPNVAALAQLIDSRMSAPVANTAADAAAGVLDV